MMQQPSHAHLAEQHGRNAEWAELSVRESKSITETEALRTNVIDLIAPNADSLLFALNGRIVTINGIADTLDTQGAIVANSADDVTAANSGCHRGSEYRVYSVIARRLRLVL